MKFVKWLWILYFFVLVKLIKTVNTPADRSAASVSSLIDWTHCSCSTNWQIWLEVWPEPELARFPKNGQILDLPDVELIWWKWMNSEVEYIEPGGIPKIVCIRVAPNFGFGFGHAEIRPFFLNSAKFGFGQIFGRIWPNLADANAAAVRSVNYLITGKN